MIYSYDHRAYSNVYWKNQSSLSHGQIKRFSQVPLHFNLISTPFYEQFVSDFGRTRNEPPLLTLRLNGKFVSYLRIITIASNKNPS